MRKLFILPLTGKITRHDGFYIAAEYNLLQSLIIASVYSSGDRTFNDPDDYEAMILEEVYDTLYQQQANLPQDIQDTQYSSMVSFYAEICKYYYGYRQAFEALVSDGWDVTDVTVSFREGICVLAMTKVSCDEQIDIPI